MKIDRFIVALTSADKFIELQPDPEGTLCLASEVARLEASQAQLLDVLKELQECSEYWSEYYVPLGIHQRIATAIAKAEGVQS